MPAFPLLWPAIAMVALTFVVWFALVGARFGHMKRTPPRAEDFASGDTSRRYFEPVERPAANLANLFEMPVLFYVAIGLLLLTEQASDSYVALAWGYVALRTVHSWFHLRGQIKPRFLTYALSNAVLLALWVGFAVDSYSAARAYTETMQTLDAAAQP